jgi:hypothetical protein
MFLIDIRLKSSKIYVHGHLLLVYMLHTVKYIGLYRDTLALRQIP